MAYRVPYSDGYSVDGPYLFAIVEEQSDVP